MNLYTLYDWITSLLRPHSASVSYKAIEAAAVEELPATSVSAATSQAATKSQAAATKSQAAATKSHTAAATSHGAGATEKTCVDVEFVPTLNFLFEKPATTPTTTTTTATSSDEQQFSDQHVASAADNDEPADDCNSIISGDSNDSTHTYIISRSSWTPATSSSTTPYAVTSTDTAELIRRQNNLSLTEEEDQSAVSSFSIEQPTSSMTIDMADQQTTATTATTTSSVDVVAANATTTATTTTTTTSSSIEEDIEEAIEISEVEEQLNSPLESLSEAAAFARPKEQPSSAKSLTSNADEEDNENDEDEEDSKDNEDEDAGEFRIDDAELSGGHLAQHFLVDDSEEESNLLGPTSKVEVTLSSNDDDFDISLPLEQRKPVHSLHEADEEDSVDQSLSNQSTTDDVSELVEEPAHESEDKTQESDDAPQETHVDESQMTEEQDHSMEEIVATNESIEVTYEAEETANTTSQRVELVTDLDEEQEPEQEEAAPERPTSTVEPLILPPLQEPRVVENKAARALTTLRLQPELMEPLELTLLDADVDEDDDEDDEESSLQLMKLRLMAMNQQMITDNAPKLSPTEAEQAQVTSTTSNSLELKQMERVPLTEFSKDVLEDITEESERQLSMSTTIEEEQEPPSLSLDESRTLLLQAGANQVGDGTSASSMMQQLEAKVQELHTQLETKDNCLASLNLQLEAARRESSAGPASARDSSSMMTNSTEYRTLQDELGGPTLDIYVEMSRRDEMIAKLTDSLQQSLTVREKLQMDSDRLGGEVQNLRRQLQDAIESMKRSSVVGWPDQESNPGQRLSEISMDLISESDDDLDRHFLTDNEERGSRSSRERQLPPQFPTNSNDDLQPEWTPAFSKQIEQFHTYLLPTEQRIFHMVQRKFDDYLGQQLASCRDQGVQELKIARDQWESEKQTAEQIQQAAHAKQMEELRKYFENKCADLEKQFSDDVFSHKSQHLASDSSSECSEMDQLVEDEVVVMAAAPAASSKEPSPRKRKRAELLLSPSHRQMTPCGLDSLGGDNSAAAKDASQDIIDLKNFYQAHIKELRRTHDDQVRKLSDRVKFYERRQGDDDYKPASESPARTCPRDQETGAGDGPANTSLIIIDEDELNLNNESQVIQRIIEEYERRLQEQLALARQDIANELEQQIQNLLSENTVDDQHWPKELILLREKFTAKSQLEITQLNIKHADEMSRLKLEFEKQLNRKNKRHSTFDAARDLEQVICERDGLRELSKSFRSVLSRLAKCVANCEEDLNSTLSEEVQRLLLPHSRSQDAAADELEVTLSGSLNNTRQMLRVPDVHSLLEVVEDPSLVQFIDSKSNEEPSEDFDLNDCLERLKSEASYLLHLSEDLHRPRAEDEAPEEPLDEPEKQEHELCCEAEDGLKTTGAVLSKFLRTNSLNDQQMGVANQRKHSTPEAAKTHTSLPPDLYEQEGNASQLSFQLVELKNRLIKSETDRQKLQQQLSHTIDRNAELGQELQALRDQLSQLNSLNHTDYNEGYGLGGAGMKSLQEQEGLDQSSASFVALQERARHLLSSSSPVKDAQQPLRDPGNSTVTLLQMIEDFCREGDKVVECGKKDREDLQSQIDTADKQLKDTRRFLEDQAAEREQERDEFQREIERLKAQLRDKEKEHSSYANASEEYAQLEGQLREVSQQLSESNAKRDKFEVELKASIDKIFVLREIISELETQVQTKAINEQVLTEKAKQLEDYVSLQIKDNDALQQEVHSLKTDIGEGYQSRIRLLEEKLQLGRPTAEQGQVLSQVAEKLRDIETTLEQKTKVLESLHNSNTASNSTSLSVTEDVSVQGSKDRTAEGSPSHPSLTIENVQRVTEKLDKHTRVEEAAIKRIRDLEMQAQQMRTGYMDLQHERDSLQGRMDEQTTRISTLQHRLEEQRQRAEQLHRAGTSDLTTKVHELQGEVQNLSEQLNARDKQMATMRQQLQRSKEEIMRLEAELTVRTKPDRSLVDKLEAEVKQKGAEIGKLKEKIRTEMINRLALPDLMQTMLADKNDEIDHLRDQLEAKEKELLLQATQAQDASPVSGEAGAGGKLSARTLSDIGSITEFPEPDVDRRAAMRSLNAPLHLTDGAGGVFLHQTMETSKEAVANLTHKRTDDLSGFIAPYPVNTFEHPHYFQALGVTAQSSDGLTPGLVPRQINFSNLTEDSKVKTPSMMVMRTPEMPRPLTPPEVHQLRQKVSTLEQEKQRQLSESEKSLQDLRRQLEQEQEQVSRQSQTLQNHQESEQKYRLRIESLEAKILEVAAQEAAERENLRRELNFVSVAHGHCEDAAAARKRELEALNGEVKVKADQLQAALRRCGELELQVLTLERDLERLKNSENSSKQYSVDEIAQQVEKELNYSAQLDSNILKAIESEDENNLDKKQQQKEVQTEEEEHLLPGTGNGTDDENFTGERELLNQLEALRAQLAVEREQCEALSKELLGEKQHSQDIQEQDVVIIEAMRKRLETALDAEDELHKQLDQERERCERLQTQLTSLQRAESRRNSSLLLKSPGDSPRKSPRADFESELGDRLRSEIKLLVAQNERERERSADAQRSSERERQRYEMELQERVAYCERLKQEMEKLSRDKESAEAELEHFNERLTLQAAEVESLEARLVTLQEAETRRANTRTRQHQENVQLQAEIHELRSKLLAAEAAKDSLDQKVVQLRFDVSRSGQREAKLAEALAQANDRLAHSTTDDTVPAQFLQKMKEINTLLVENTQENKQMAETVQFLVGERLALQKKCEELMSGSGNTNVTELEERCRQLIGRYLRVESHRKALVYQKRYLKLTLEGYQASEQLALQNLRGGGAQSGSQRNIKKKFKTVALAIIAIQRIKYIGRIWHTGKRIVSKSVFTITQQRSPGLAPTLPSPLPVPNSSTLPTNNNNSHSLTGRLSYAPVSPPMVNYSTLQPIMLPSDFNLQAPTTSLQNSITNNNNSNDANGLPSLARLDWPTMQKPKRAHARHH